MMYPITVKTSLATPVRFGSNKPGNSGDGTTTSKSPTLQSVKSMLAHDLQLRLEAMSPQYQKLAPFINYDIEDYANYHRQSPLVRLIARFIIGFFQPWRKVPAFEQFRRQLEKQIPGAKQDLAIQMAFNQEFNNRLVQLSLSLQRLNTSISDQENRALLLQTLSKGAQVQKAQSQSSLNSRSLYMAMFQGVAQDPSFVPPAAETLKEMAKGFLDLPEQFANASLSPVLPSLQAASALSPSLQMGPTQYKMPLVIGTDSNQPVRKAPYFTHDGEVNTLETVLFVEQYRHTALLGGEIEDQKDVMIQLALKPQLKGRSEAFIIQNRMDMAFNNYWLDLPVQRKLLSPFSQMAEMEGQDVIQQITSQAREMAQRHPVGEQKALFLLSNEPDKLKFVLPALTELERQYPTVKFIVGGLQQPSALMSARMHQSVLPMDITKPSLAEALKTIHDEIPAALSEIESRHQVKIHPDAVDTLARIIEGMGGRPPLPMDMVKELRKMAAWFNTQQATQRSGIRQIHASDAERYHQETAVKGQNIVQMNLKNAGQAVSTETLEDVIGQDEAVKQLRIVSSLLKNYNQLRQLKTGPHSIQIKVPKLISLVGPPGTGKTMAARALANESGVTFIPVKGSDFVEMFVGVGASRVRALYEEAAKKQPAIVYIDEVDSIASQRKGATDGGKEFENTLNEILTQIDGFNGVDGVTTIISTNQPDILDTAFQSRQFQKITFTLPNQTQRAEIIKSHLTRSGYPMEPGIDFSALAKQANGFAGRELEILVNRSINANPQLMSLLQEHASQVAPDLEALRKKLPPVTQTMLKRELEKMQAEKKDGTSGRGPLSFADMSTSSSVAVETQ